MISSHTSWTVQRNVLSKLYYISTLCGISLVGLLKRSSNVILERWSIEHQHCICQDECISFETLPNIIHLSSSEPSSTFRAVDIFIRLSPSSLSPGVSFVSNLQFFLTTFLFGFFYFNLYKLFRPNFPIADLACRLVTLFLLRALSTSISLYFKSLCFITNVHLRHTITDASRLATVQSSSFFSAISAPQTRGKSWLVLPRHRIFLSRHR